jgi:centromere/kinetochore protein ZW10
LEGLQERETYVEFLTKEVSYNARLLGALQSIQDVHSRLARAEELITQRKIYEALLALEGRTNIPFQVPYLSVRCLERLLPDSVGEIRKSYAIIGRKMFRCSRTHSRPIQ